jgi:hypothetical protein
VFFIWGGIGYDEDRKKQCEAGGNDDEKGNEDSGGKDDGKNA